MVSERKDHIHTRIWREVPESTNPFATQAAYCHGFDVYGDMLGRARWVEMLYLLFRGEPPNPSQAQLLETLAVALANPGPRDPSVHAAMCGGVAGSTAAASLMAALSVGAGRYGGAREVFDAMNQWGRCGDTVQDWFTAAMDFASETLDIWPQAEHPAGFDPHGVDTPTIVVQTLTQLAQTPATPRLTWLEHNRCALEVAVGMPVSMTAVAAVAFLDLGLRAEEGEMLYLILRLPGAAAHMLEQAYYGVKRFPFYPVEISGEHPPEGCL